MWKKVIGGKSLREGVLKAEGTGGREVERWHGSEVCTPEELRSVHTCSTLQESLQFLVVPRTVLAAGPAALLNNGQVSCVGLNQLTPLLP